MKKDGGAEDAGGGSGGTAGRGSGGSSPSSGGSGGSPSGNGGSGGSGGSSNMAGRDGGTGMGGMGMGGMGMGGSTGGRDGGAGMGGMGMGGMAGRDAGVAMLTITPTTKDFMMGGLNLESAPTVFTVTNTGGSSVMATPVLGGGGAAHFVMDNGCLAALASQATCMVTVKFKPTTVGAKTATLTVSGGGAMVMATLSGTGVEPSMLTVTPMMHDFGNIMLNATSPPVTFTVKNTGNGPTGALTVLTTGTSSWKVDPASTCAASLVKDAMCTITLNMLPTTAGMKMGTLTVTAANGGMLTVNLLGNAVDMVMGPALAFDAATKAAGDSPVGTGKTVMFTLSNPGTAMTGIPTFTVMGANMADFVVTAQTCTAVLAPAGTCTVTVTFTPSATGARTATLVASAMPGGSAMATITGNGTPTAALTLTPPSKDFGLIAEGSTGTNTYRDFEFTLKNTGTITSGATTVTVTAGADDFAIQANNCGPALMMNAMCTFTVRFRPITSGEKAGAVTVTGTAVSAALSGRMVNTATGLVNGLRFRYFEAPAGTNWTALPAVAPLTPVKVGVLAATEQIKLGTIPQRDNNYAIEYTGYINIPATTDYTFSTLSDDGSRLWIDDVLVVDNDGTGPVALKSGLVAGLTQGYHRIRVEYYNGAVGANLAVSWAGAGITSGEIPAVNLFRVDIALPAYVDPAPLPPVPGLYYRSYDVAAGISALPSFATMIPVKAGFVTTVDHVTARHRAENVAIEFTGYINAAAPGDHRFAVNSDDGSRLWIDDILVVDNDGTHGAREIEGVVNLAMGAHRYRLAYFNGGGADALTASWAPPGVAALVPIPAASFTRSTTQPAVYAGTPVQGLNYRLYMQDGSWTMMPNFDLLTPVAINTTVPNFDLTAVAGGRTTNFGVDFRGYIYVATTADYNFTLNSDDGSILWIDGVETINFDGTHGLITLPTLPTPKLVRLEAGHHSIRVGYFQGAGGLGLEVKWALGTATPVAIPNDVLRRN